MHGFTFLDALPKTSEPLRDIVSETRIANRASALHHTISHPGRIEPEDAHQHGGTARHRFPPKLRAGEAEPPTTVRQKKTDEARCETSNYPTASDSKPPDRVVLRAFVHREHTAPGIGCFLKLPSAIRLQPSRPA